MSNEQKYEVLSNDIFELERKIKEKMKKQKNLKKEGKRKFVGRYFKWGNHYVKILKLSRNGEHFVTLRVTPNALTMWGARQGIEIFRDDSFDEHDSIYSIMTELPKEEFERIYNETKGIIEKKSELSKEDE